MIASIIKTNNFDLLDSLKLHLTQESMKFLIRILFNIEKYNQTQYLREDFRLNEEETEKLCDWLVRNKTIVKKQYTNQIIPNMELYQHESVSLIYYYYNWGFQKYFDLIKKSKNQADKWIEKDEEKLHQQGRNKIDYFLEIFHYLNRVNKIDEFKKLGEKIKSEIILKPDELKQLNSVISSIGSYNISYISI